MAFSRGNTAEAVMPRRQLWSASGSSYGASGFNLLEFPEAPRTLRIWSRSELLSEVVGLSYGGAGNPDVVTAALAAVDAISLAGLRGILWPGFVMLFARHGGPGGRGACRGVSCGPGARCRGASSGPRGLRCVPAW